MNLNFFNRFLKNTQNIKFQENPSSGNQVVPSRKADKTYGHNEDFFTIL